MIASLMMYQRPELTAAHETLWRAIRAALRHRGINAPRALSQEAEEFSVWRHPELVLSQTCGMPYRLWLHEEVALVGTPDYGLEGCPPGYYRSAFVVRADDLRGSVTAFKNTRFAYNQKFSQSGYGAAYFHTQPLGFFFADQVPTGAHLASARAVAEGRADIAALDAVTWRNAQRFDPFTAQLRVLEWTEPSPGLPLITARENDPEVMFDAVKDAISALPMAVSKNLGLRGLTRIPKDAYLGVPNPPDTLHCPG